MSYITIGCITSVFVLAILLWESVKDHKKNVKKYNSGEPGWSIDRLSSSFTTGVVISLALAAISILLWPLFLLAVGILSFGAAIQLYVENSVKSETDNNDGI